MKKNRLLALLLSLAMLATAMPIVAVEDCGDADAYKFDGSYYLSYVKTEYAQFPNGETPWFFGYTMHSDGSLKPMSKYLNNWSHDAPQDSASGNFTYGTIGVVSNSFGSGAISDPTLTFTCPYDGEILLPQATVSCGATSNDGGRIRLTLNGYNLFPEAGWLAMTKGEKQIFPETKLKVKKGDVLTWQMNKAGPGLTNNNANTYSDSIAWNDIEVHYVNNSQSAAGFGNGVMSPFPADIKFVGDPTSPSKYFSKGIQGEGNWYYQNAEIDTDNYLDLDFVGNQWFGGWKNNWTPGAIQSGTGFHAGEGGDPTFTYVCPQDGLLAIPATTASCNSANSKDGVQIKILKNAAPVYPASGWIHLPPATSKTIPDLLFEVKAGDKIHFRVNCVANQDADGCTWSINLRYAETDSYKSVNFTDLKDHWAKDTILEMYERGLVSGRANGTFAPDDNVTRAEFLAMATRVCQFTESDYNDAFEDVHFTAWYARNIITAHENNLIDYALIEDGDKIKPEAGVTREEAASILVNTHKMKKRKLVDNANLYPFTDSYTISAWAEDYVAKAVQLGLMQGDENKLNPQGILTRAEAATLLKNLINALNTEDPDGTLSKVHKGADGNYLPVYQNTDLQELIMTAYESGAKSITIPKGVYRTDCKNNGLGLYLDGLHDFDIYADDVVLSYKAATQDVMRVINCSNMEIHGLTIDHEVQSSYMGIIQDCDPNGMYFDVWFDPGHVPQMLNTRFIGPQTSTLLYYTPEGLLLPSTGGRTIDGNIRKIGNDLYRLYVSRTAGNFAVQTGDIVSGRSASGNNLTIANCSDLYWEDLTLYNGMNGIFESNAEKCSDFERLRIVPGPKPELATMERIRSVNGTGYFVRGSRQGGVITNSEISATNDDGVNVHATYDRVAAVEGNNTYVVALHGSAGEYRVGDEIRFTSQNGIIRGEAKILSATKLSGFTPSSSLTGFSVGQGYVRLVMDKEIPNTIFNDRSCNMDTLCRGLTFKNCTFSNNSPRAILTHAIDSLIENCTFNDIRRWAILAAPELPTWNEGDYMRNLTIKGCTFNGNGRGSDTLMAAIGIWGEPTLDGNYKGNQNINILNNTFSGSYIHDIVLSYVTGATVSGNTFGAGADDAADYGYGDYASINLFFADDVTFSGNQFTSSRPKVLVGKDVTNVTGLPQ